MEQASSAVIASHNVGIKRRQGEEDDTDLKRPKHPTLEPTKDENLDVKTHASTGHHSSKRKRKHPLHTHYSRHRMNANAYSKEETDYYFENGFRKVYPYYFTFHSFCKERWLGKTLREIYSTEFRFYPPEFYEKSIKSGDMLLNMKRLDSLDVKLKSNDMVTSKIHRHEGPVLGTKIEILHDDNKYLVVNKPSSIPIHPCGRYRNNTLCYILKREFGFENLHGCHRIDRLTSGIVVFGKTKQYANKIIEEIRQRTVEKEYICKVVGEFPVDIDSKPIVCEQPVTVFDHKLGLCIAGEVEGLQAKDACTEFYRISTNGRTSIVMCKPKTGRTHQIRVHLQYLGYPIVNDPFYNNEAWGEDRFKPGPCSRDPREVVFDISRTYDNDPYRYLRKDVEKNNSSSESARNDNCKLEIVESTSNKASEISLLANRENDKSPSSVEAISSENLSSTGSKPSIDAHYCHDCEECRNPLPDPEIKWMQMYLHSFRYKGSDWEFKTLMPEWTEDSFDDSNMSNQTITSK